MGLGGGRIRCEGPPRQGAQHVGDRADVAGQFVWSLERRSRREGIADQVVTRGHGSGEVSSAVTHGRASAGLSQLALR